MRHDPSLDGFARAAASPPPAAAGHGWWAGLIGLWLAVAGWLVAGHAGAIRLLRLPDSDDALRLLQVRGWMAGQSWFDLRQYRLDPPLGADIHWSRLVDLPLAGLIVPLTPLLGQGVAERIAVTMVPLATLLCAMVLLAGIARAVIAPAAWWWPALLLATASPALGMLAPLRIDHHGWQIVALLGLLYGLVTPVRRRGGIMAGVAIGASLTIGVEMLPYLGAGLALAVLGWLHDAAERARVRAMAAAAALATLAGWWLFVPPAQRGVVACDALSAAYAPALLAGCATLWLATMRGGSRARRGVWLGAVAVAVIGMAVWTGGAACLADPYRAVDPQARRLWLDSVAEALPLWRQDVETAWASLALPFTGIAGALWMLLRDRRDMPCPSPQLRISAGLERAWLVIFAMGLLSVLLALASTRAAVAAQVLALPGAAALGFAGRRWLAAHRAMLLRVFGSVLLFLGVSAIAPRLLIHALAAPAEVRGAAAREEQAAACMAPAALARLNVLPPGTMLGFIDDSADLLLHTHHRALAGPYHRNGRAIADTMLFWTGDAAPAEVIARRHAIDYVVACGEPAEAQLYDKRAPGGFHARLMAGRTPAWLAPLPIAGSPWRVWRVRRLPGGGPAA